MSTTDLHRLQLTANESPDVRRDFITAMGRVAASVSLVTTDGTAGRFGQTVTAMMSVSADPPTLLIGLFRGVPVADAVRTNRSFAVSVLGQDHESVARDFAGQSDPSTRYRFDDRWTSLRTGSPVLRGAAAVFDCHAEGFLVAGSHLLIVGRVIEARSADSIPLTYFARSYGRHHPAL